MTRCDGCGEIVRFVNVIWDVISGEEWRYCDDCFNEDEIELRDSLTDSSEVNREDTGVFYD